MRRMIGLDHLCTALFLWTPFLPPISRCSTLAAVHSFTLAFYRLLLSSATTYGQFLILVSLIFHILC